MKNVTLSAREELIQRGRQVARERHTTLNAMFREWLEGLDRGELRDREYREVMRQMSGQVKVGGRKFTRKEMNER